jgi:hypothetical protein
LVLALHRQWRGQSIPLLGQHLQDVLPKLRGKVLEVEVELKKRPYLGHGSKGRCTFRLMAIRKEDSQAYHIYLTNLPPSNSPPRMWEESMPSGGKWRYCSRP